MLQVINIMNPVQIQAQAEIILRKRESERNKNYELRLAYYRENPIDYIVERLGIKRETIDWSLLPEYKNHVWDGTANPFVAMLDALVNWEWCGIEAATATSKTFIAACVVCWFLECYENSIVITTAPKESQLTLNIWKEITSLYPRFNKGHLDSLVLRMKKEVVSKKKSYEWAAFGFVAGTSEAKETEDKAQGFHAEHMLIIFEETPGIPKSIINTFKATSQAPHNLILALGNPNHQLDNLHQFCKLERVRHIRISGLDYPNIVCNNASIIPGGKSVQGIKDILNDVGSVDHPRYLSRVRGISPGQSIDSLINVQWCYSSAEKTENDVEKGLYALGVDVANSENGDQAALAFGKGAYLINVKAFQCPDANQLGKLQVRELIKRNNIDPRLVGVDGVGVGAGTINALKEYDLRVTNLMGGAAAYTIQNSAYKFKNLRSQMWWQLREDLRSGEIHIPNDEELIADLCAPTYKDNDKYIIVESKDEIKKRLGRSPNKGDAAVYWNWVRKQRRKITAGNKII